MSAVIFDLDGTLIDSAPDIHAAANRLLEDQGAEPLDLAAIVSFIGNGVPVLVERIMGVRSLAPSHADLTAAFLRHYEADPATLTRPYPGVPEMLDSLREAGHLLGVCTNKPEAPARAILDALGLGERFAVVLGGDSLPQRKPAPEPLLAAARTLGAPAVYVGDSETDAAAAQAAALPFALFTEGYRKSPVEDLPHDVAFSDFADLPGLVPGLLAARG